MADIIDFLVEWGMEAGKKVIKGPMEKAQLKKELKEYILRQEKIHQLASLTSELDFEGLAKELLTSSVIDDMGQYLFDPFSERGPAKANIIRKAKRFEIAESGKAEPFVQGALEVCRNFYRGKIDKEKWFVANEQTEDIKDIVYKLLKQNSSTPDRQEQEDLEVPRVTLEKLKEALKEQFDRADYYSLALDPVETMLYPNIIEKNEEVRYFSTKNQTALLKKLQTMEEKLEPGNPVLPLLMTGEGGIGKTVAMLQTAKQLLQKGKHAFYVPLRRLTSALSLEQFIREEIFRNEEALFEKIWKESSKINLYLLLDGFNEVQKNLKPVLVSEFRNLASRGYILVVSSRRTFEEEGCMDSHYQRLCMERLSWEKVSSYLNHKKLQIPDREKMSEILGIPLMLILYTRVRSVMCQGMDKDPCGSWREDLSSEGNLLWNYIQCQVFAAKKILTEKGMLGKQGYRNVDFAAASEYIAPYLAARMNQRGEYEAAFTDVERWINEGCELLQQSKRYENRRKFIAYKTEEEEDVCLLPSANQFLRLLSEQMSILRTESKGRIFFVHQEFQDILHYIYIEASFQAYSDGFFCGAFSDYRLPYDVITRISEMLEEKEVHNIWAAFSGKNSKDTPQPGQYGIANLVEVYKRKYQNDLSYLDFTGMNLEKAILTGTILSQNGRKACFKNTIIGAGTFSSVGHSAAVSSIAFAPTGGKFVSASYDKTLGIWSTGSGERLAELEGHQHYVRCASWSPDGRTIVSGGDDKELIVWDVLSWLENGGKKVKLSLTAHEGWIYSVDWALSGEWFASGDSQGILCIWKFENGKTPELRKKIVQAHKDSIRCLSWSPIEENIFASGSTDGQLKLWVRQEEITSVKAAGAGISALAWSPDGKMIVVGAGSEISIWKISIENPCFSIEKIYDWNMDRDTVSGLVWTKEFLACALGREICVLRMEYNNQSEEAGTVVWNQDKEPDLAFIAGHKSQIQCLAWSAMEQKLLTGSDDSSIRIWKARSPSWQKDWNCIRSIEGASLPVRCVAWSEDGSCAVGGYDDNVLRIWDVEKEVCRKVFRGHENRIKCVDWKGEYLVSGSNDHTIRIWNANYSAGMDPDDEESLKIKKSGGAVNCVKWFSDQQRVISGSDDSSLLIWNWCTQDEVHLEGHEKRVYGVDLSPDGKTAVSGSNDRTIRFWDTLTGKEQKTSRIISDEKSGHREPIRAVAWSRKKNLPYLVSASNDKTLICWECTESGVWKERNKMTGHNDFVYCLAWMPGAVLSSGFRLVYIN